MNSLELTGWILVIEGIMLFVFTTRTQDMNLAVREKTEAIGGVELRDVGYAYRHKIRIVSVGFICSGIACFVLSSALEIAQRRKGKKRIKNVNQKPNPTVKTPVDEV